MSDTPTARIAAIQRIHFPSEDGLSCDCLAPLPDGDLDTEAFRVHLAHAILAAIRPHIAAAVREWAAGMSQHCDADEMPRAQPGYIAGGEAMLGALTIDADAIAERVTGGGQ